MLTVLDHALGRDRLARMRETRTGREEFVRLVEQLGIILAVEAGRKLTTRPCPIRTPLEETTGDRIDKPICLVPILRAGLGLLKGFQSVFPEAAVGHLGLKRDESTLLPTVYLEKTPPDLSGRTVMVLDPMLATGHSAVEALRRLKILGATDLLLICCLAAPEGVREVRAAHPDTPLLIAALDRQLDARGFILPGLGDAGDRQFGTT
ncbi:MAG: uracil phosphoribosyltransferase [Candidatus Methylacidiphilales bacterium]|nr:uracil phosphoribosyltransferase [Candidatus Methylacidiphilales bacterium]